MNISPCPMYLAGPRSLRDGVLSPDPVFDRRVLYVCVYGSEDLNPLDRAQPDHFDNHSFFKGFYSGVHVGFSVQSGYKPVVALDFAALGETNGRTYWLLQGSAYGWGQVAFSENFVDRFLYLLEVGRGFYSNNHVRVDSVTITCGGEVAKNFVFSNGATRDMPFRPFPGEMPDWRHEPNAAFDEDGDFWLVPDALIADD
jgi:hypothetical protein